MSISKLEHYILGETIGKGSFAKVKIAQHEFTGNEVAVKILNKSKIREMKAGGRIKRETNILRHFNHPNIIKMYEILETQTDIYIFLEFANKGEISRLISPQQKLSEKEAKFLFRQLIAAVEHCHSNLIAHRDLKPDNIFLDEYGALKVGDFGLANLMRDGKFMKTDCGSPNYMAPEVISRKRYCGSEADIWSCGVILYALLAGSLPFEGSIPVLFKKIVAGRFHLPTHFSPEVKNLVSRMLNCDPLKRIKLHEIKEHAWIRYTDVIYLDPRELRHYHNECLKIKSDVLEKVKQMGFNFGRLTDDKLKEAIEKRKEYSFVTGYNLMFDQSVKKNVVSKLMKAMQDATISKLNKISCEDEYQARINQDTNISERAQIVESLKNQAFDDAYSGIFDSAIQKSSRNALKKRHDANDTELQLEYQQWHYGMKYTLSPDRIMAGITQTLIELNTMYFVKAGPYKVKCFYHVHKDFGTFALKGKDQQVRGNILHGNTPQAQNSNRQEKFSKEEVAFKVQIFALPNKKEHIVDIEKIKGHSIVFLDYCQKFIQVLDKKLYTNPRAF